MFMLASNSKNTYTPTMILVLPSSAYAEPDAWLNVPALKTAGTSVQQSGRKAKHGGFREQPVSLWSGAHKQDETPHSLYHRGDDRTKSLDQVGFLCGTTRSQARAGSSLLKSVSSCQAMHFIVV